MKMRGRKDSLVCCLMGKTVIFTVQVPELSGYVKRERVSTFPARGSVSAAAIIGTHGWKSGRVQGLSLTGKVFGTAFKWAGFLRVTTMHRYY